MAKMTSNRMGSSAERPAANRAAAQKNYQPGNSAADTAKIGRMQVDAKGQAALGRPVNGPYPYSPSASNSPSTPWSPGGRKNRNG